MRSILCAAALALATTTALAIDEDNADVLAPYCKLSNEQLAAGDQFSLLMNGNCYGIIAGVRSTLEEIHTALVTGRITFVFCSDVPADIPLAKVVQTVVQYVDSHPGESPRRLSGLAILALHDAWPCQK